MHWHKWFWLAVSMIVSANKSATRSNVIPRKSNILSSSFAIPVCNSAVFTRSSRAQRILRRVSNDWPAKDREKSANPWWTLSTNTTMARNNLLAYRSNPLVFNVMRSRLPVTTGHSHRHRQNERQLCHRRIDIVLGTIDKMKAFFLLSLSFFSNNSAFLVQFLLLLLLLSPIFLFGIFVFNKGQIIGIIDNGDRSEARSQPSDGNKFES